MARRRTLRPEEEALWHAVARTAQPMHAPLKKRKSDELLNRIPENLVIPEARKQFPAFKIGEKSVATRAVAASPVPPLRMDAKAFAKMTRGKLVPEAKIDLHGMTVAEAHPELIHFILNAQSNGLRLVLVITGKGKPGTDHGPIPQRAGVLRQQLPHWLHQAPLGQVILQVTEAHLRHGGAGAFYVYLRRHR